MEKYKFPCKPKANPESVIVGPQYRFTIIDDRVLRYEWSADGVFEDRASTFAINRDFPKPEFRVEDKEDQLDIFTSTMQVTYDKQRFSANGLSVDFTSKTHHWGLAWKYGTETVDNLGGTARTLDGVDGRCDLGTGIISRAGYAVIDDSESMLFDGQGFVTGRKAGDRIDGYLFAYGLDFKGAMKSFYNISGSQPPVPRWCLGNWWSRYHAYTDTEYLALMDKFGVFGIPLSVAVIDMDWHLVKGDNIPHSGWTGYTWNRELFPDPKDFTNSLHDKRLKVTLNDHPHSGVASHEEMYEEVARALDHDTTHKAPILFDSTSQKYMHAYLNIVHRHLSEQGCDFAWIDWQQGSFSRVPGIDPLWVLNHFHYQHQILNKGKTQALTFSRYAGPGSHRYPVGFSGDTVTSWASLEFQPEFTATASNIGYGWWSHDIGGHMFGIRDDEMTARWVQFGVFSPIFRLHSSHSPWMSKEPWLYRSESQSVIQTFMQLRHALVPYIYSTIAVDAESTYLPLVQPLYWNFPLHDSAFKFPNEYYFGSSLVVAPIVQPRSLTTNLAKTRVWVPPQRHVDIMTGVVYDGEQEIDMYRPLNQIPVLAAEGSIIPLDSAVVPANGCTNPEGLEVMVVVGCDGSFDIHENVQDDARTSDATESQRIISIEYNQAAGQLKLGASSKRWKIYFISAEIERSSVQVKPSKPLSEQPMFTTDSRFVENTVIEIPASPDSGTITIELGRDPQLAVGDYMKTVKSMILDFQIPYSAKDDIWDVLQTSQPMLIKIARLTSLGLDKEWLGPIFEVLLADSRGNKE